MIIFNKVFWYYPFYIDVVFTLLFILEIFTVPATQKFWLCSGL